MALYDTIGLAYTTTRRADPYIASRLAALVTADPQGRYLDIGCGTGNYLAAMRAKGLDMQGIDVSTVMLEQAAKQVPGDKLQQGHAESLPFEDNTFAGALAVFTLHHWTDMEQGLKEAVRVIQPGARLVMLTFDEEQMRGYWLNAYFPRMMERSWKLLPSKEEMALLLQRCGFTNIQTEKYVVQDDLQDGFLYAHKRRPEAYLLPEVRRNASSFSAFCEENELHEGLTALEADIHSGHIHTVMQQYENESGDYLFMMAQKPASVTR